MLKDAVAGESASIARGRMAVCFQPKTWSRAISFTSESETLCLPMFGSPTDIQVDQSTLTGESLPIEAESGRTAFSGSVVIRGEASGEVTATGVRTYFGKTAELLRAATTVSHLQAIIFTIVKYLVMLIALLCSSFSLFPASAVAHDGNAAVCPHVAGGLSSCGAAGDFHFGDRAWLHGTGWQRSSRDQAVSD